MSRKDQEQENIGLGSKNRETLLSKVRLINGDVCIYRWFANDARFAFVSRIVGAVPFGNLFSNKKHKHLHTLQIYYTQEYSVYKATYSMENYSMHKEIIGINTIKNPKPISLI